MLEEVDIVVQDTGDRRTSRRLAAVGESATLAVDSRAKALRAAGRPIIGFGAGEPDFPTPPHVVEAAVVAARSPADHRYSPAGGLPELKEAIAAASARDSGLVVSPREVLVTNGGKHAVITALLSVVDPGDEVIVPAPFWTTYPEAVRLADGVPVVVMADQAQGFKVTVEQLEAARTPRTRAVIITSPSNPTGAVHSRDELVAIGEWAAEHRLWVVSDEIYEHLVYDDAPATGSLPQLCPEARERCLVVNGVAKTYAMTGWRVGWMIGPADVVAAAANMQSHTTSNVANVSQRAAIAALTGGLDPVREMRLAFDRRRRRMVSMLDEIPGVRCPLPPGAFYVFPSVTALLEGDGALARTSAELASVALDRADVALVPGEAFGAPGHLRLSYALGDDDLVEGLTRLQALLGRS